MTSPRDAAMSHGGFGRRPRCRRPLTPAAKRRVPASSASRPTRTTACASTAPATPRTTAGGSRHPYPDARGAAGRRPSGGRRRAGAPSARRPGLAGQPGHQDLDDELGVEAARPAHVEVGSGDEVDGLGDLGSRGAATARAPSWPRTARYRGRPPRPARRPTSSPSSASMLAKWPCSVAMTCMGARPPASSMRCSTTNAAPGSPLSMASVSS